MYSKILVPVDGSELSELALPHALELAKRYQAKLIFVRCTQEADGLTLQAAMTQGPSHYDALMEANRKEAEEYLASLLTREGIGEHTESTAAMTGQPAEQILRKATKEKVDLIVISSHGRGGLGRFLFGSVAEKVLRHSPCPVMVVGPNRMQNSN